MFKNVGKQIKTLAILFLVLGIVLLVGAMGGIALATAIGWLYVAVILVSIVFVTLLIYGFGQLIYKVEQINDNLEDLKEIIAKKNF